MALFRNIAQGIRSLFRRHAIEQDMDEELRDFVDASTADKVRSGMPAERAAYAARVEMGSANAVKLFTRSQTLRTRIVAQPRLHPDCRAVACPRDWR
jgi:hypothetical protein